MNSLLEDDDERDTNDREVTLNTGMILGIFFGLVLLCGGFFGFGYKMGSHKVVAPVETSAVESSPAPTANFSSFKPAAGSPNGSNSSSAARRNDAEAADARSAREDAATAEPPEAAPIVRESAAPPTAHSATLPVAPTTAVPEGAGNFLVQVAAVTHREDAVLLINALRAKGYPVSAHTQPQDQFFHIQVGPFPTHQEAEAAKQKLLADGYQPIIK